MSTMDRLRTVKFRWGCGLGNGALRRLGSILLPLILASIYSLIAAPQARANVTYTYVGNNFTSLSGNGGGLTLSDHITITFSVAAPLPPNLMGITLESGGAGLLLSFDMNDGVHDFTLGPSIYVYGIFTSSTGEITRWWISNWDGLSLPPYPYVLSEVSPIAQDVVAVTPVVTTPTVIFPPNGAAIDGPPGTWTSSTSNSLSISTSSLPNGKVGSVYSQSLAATGGTPPYTWSIPFGILPLGLSLAGSTISGTPTSFGNFNFTVQVTDSAGVTASLAFGIQIGNISAPTLLKASQFDCSSQTGCLGTQIQLTWDYGNETVDGFMIDRQTVSEHRSGTWPEPPILVSLANCAQSPTGWTCTYADTAPTAWATYNYRARAFKGTDESANSNEAICFQLNLYMETFNHQMVSEFLPGGNISDFVNTFGYDHLNWVSQVTYAPVDLTSNPSFWQDRSGNHLPAPPPGIIDPPSGGWWYRQADSLPYYWDEQSGFNLAYYYVGHIFQNFVEFRDIPSLPFNHMQGDYYQFFTSLVGVQAVGSVTQSTPLAHFSWSSNNECLYGNCTLGGITGFRTSNLDPPTQPGQGSIFNVQVVKNEDLPLDVRDLLIQAGAHGISTAPKIDKDAPMTAAFLSGSQGMNGWYTGPVTVTLIATDIDGPSDIYGTGYTLGAGTLTASTGPFTVSDGGNHTVEFSSVDRAGNAETQKSLTFKIDATPPVITVSANPASLWPPNGKMVTATISGTMADNLSGINASTAAFVVKDSYGLVQPSGSVSLGSNGTYSFTISLQASRAGNDKNGRLYTIEVSAQDNAGNVGSSGTTVIVPHDKGK